MALRVLLADESTTIKKVMQLALQDFGVEVKSVPVGLDVVPVAKSFKPDIVFVDVLLQKRSGYEVIKELKSEKSLNSLPVVLMWSGFMELDEAKTVESGANRRLEKPFDAETLRGLIEELVPRLRENIITEYLTFPPLPDFQEDAPATTGFRQPPAPTPAGFDVEASSPVVGPLIDSTSGIYQIPELGEDETPEEGLDEFQTVPLSAGPVRSNKPTTPPPSMAAAEEGWSHQDLSKFKVDLPKVELGGDLSEFMIPSDDLSSAEVRSDGEFEEVTFTQRRPSPMAAETPVVSTAPRREPPPNTAPSSSAMDDVRAEKILREESRAVLERIAWQIMPEICERLVKEELNRLLKEAEKNI